MQQLQAYSQQSVNDPTAALAPIRQAGLQQINQSYAGVPQQVTQQLASRGYGSSGDMGDSLYKVGLAKAGAQSGLEGQLATQGIQNQQFGASLGEQLLNSLKGTSSSSSGTTSGQTSQSGSNSGTETKPGPSIFSSIAGLGGLLLGLPVAGGGSTGGNWLNGVVNGRGGGGPVSYPSGYSPSTYTGSGSLIP